MQWSDQQLVSYRIAWCHRWVVRAKELECVEQEDSKRRPPEVAAPTAGKRLLLTGEMLNEIGFEDMDALRLLSEGGTLAGPTEPSPSFETQNRPCLTTLEQLKMNAGKLKEVVLRTMVSSGDLEVDKQLLAETRLELEKGWADGPYSLEELEEGATVSRRFPVSQGSKTRMIDDFRISGVNDSCEVHNKIDLHRVDTVPGQALFSQEQLVHPQLWTAACWRKPMV